MLQICFFFPYLTLEQNKTNEKPVGMISGQKEREREVGVGGVHEEVVWKLDLPVNHTVQAARSQSVHQAESNVQPGKVTRSRQRLGQKQLHGIPSMQPWGVRAPRSQCWQCGSTTGAREAELVGLRESSGRACLSVALQLPSTWTARAGWVVMDSGHEATRCHTHTHRLLISNHIVVVFVVVFFVVIIIIIIIIIGLVNHIWSDQRKRLKNEVDFWRPWGESRLPQSGEI